MSTLLNLVQSMSAGVNLFAVDGTIPEPSTVVLLIMGGVALLGYAWRKRRG